MSSRGKSRTARRKETAGNAVYSVVKIVSFVLIMMVIYRLGSMAYSYGERLFGEPPMAEAPGEDITVTIEASDDMDSIARKLEEAGLIRDADFFVLQEKVYGYKSEIEPGDYVLNTSQNAEELMQVLYSSREEEDE